MRKANFNFNDRTEYNNNVVTDGGISIYTSHQNVVENIFSKLPYHKDAYDKITSFVRMCSLEYIAVNELFILDASVNERLSKLASFLWSNDEDAEDLEVELFHLYCYTINTKTRFTFSRLRNKLRMSYEFSCGKQILSGVFGSDTRKVLHTIKNKQVRSCPTQAELLVAMAEYQPIHIKKHTENEYGKWWYNNVIQSFAASIEHVSKLNLKNYRIFSAVYESCGDFTMLLTAKKGSYRVRISSSDLFITHFLDDDVVELSHLP